MCFLFLYLYKDVLPLQNQTQCSNQRCTNPEQLKFVPRQVMISVRNKELTVGT